MGAFRKNGRITVSGFASPTHILYIFPVARDRACSHSSNEPSSHNVPVDTRASERGTVLQFKFNSVSVKVYLKVE